jgi:hypothetical protein
MQSSAGSRTIWLTLLVSALTAGMPGWFGGAASAGTIDIWSLPNRGSNSVDGINVGVATTPA